MTTRPLNAIANEIESIWSKQGKGVNYAARPYLDAMKELDSINDTYGADTARYVVQYFLANAAFFKGADAKRLKAELRSILEAKV